MNNNPIGIFDSGIGGLTVAQEIMKVLPNENIIYLGDTARVPYGNRDTEVITKFALQMAEFLLKRKVKALVVACNTISSTCLDKIEQLSPVPVIGVIKPTIHTAMKLTRTKKLGVIGTRATIKSKVYEHDILKHDNGLQIFSRACPLFVPLAEEGLSDHPAAKLIADDYLLPLKKMQIDTLILGCTHYPLLNEVIRETMGNEVLLINSAQPTAGELKIKLTESKLLNTNITEKPSYKFYLTGAPESVYPAANKFFANSFPGELEKVKLAM